MAVESAILVTIGTSLASGLLRSVLQKSADSLSKTSSAAALKSAIFGNLKPQLLDLQRKLTKLDALLRCAETLNPVLQHNHNQLLLLWLKRVKEAAIFADNLLDDISYNRLQRQAESNMAVKLLNCGSSGSLVFRVKIGRKISKFKAMTAEIYREAAELGISPVEWLANSASYQPPIAMSTDLREIRENPDTSIVVGRQPDEDLIVGELCHPHNEEVLGVIAMVGMSGVGKTTLAKKIYYSETVTKNYEQKSWISISQDFSLKRLLNEMLQSLTRKSHNLSNKDTMEQMLRECLEAKRYLLVLDDVWNPDKDVWGSVRSSLVRVTEGCTSSKVLVTTQSSEVASVMGAYLTHRVEVLSNDDAWALFEGKSFANRSQQQVSDLRDIGKRILRKCGGLPLAISTLASLLASMDGRSQWESVDRDQVWKLPSETKIMPWLLLSFNHLPDAAIKQCFAHFSMIPKGGIFEEEMLTQIWISQGFIQPSETSSNSPEIVRKYIKSMVDNNLLQPIEHTKPTRFTMHDLIHDLALYVSMDSRLYITHYNDLHKASAGVEHVFIYGGNNCNSVLNFPEGNTQSNLRTLICINATISIDLVAQARFLRQLHLIRCGLKKIPRSIGELKHLRILCVNENPFEYLPETIGKLYNLRLLSLTYCSRLVELPQQVTKLLNLRMIATTKAVHMPKGMGQLTHLTRLPLVKLKARNGGEITELRSLQHLTGVVCIDQLENISSKEEAMGAGLKNKEGITELMLAWTIGHEDSMVSCRDEEVLEGLQPHSDLKVLRVANFEGKRFPPWLSDGLYCNSLTCLSLVNSRRIEQLPTLGCLPYLTVLSIAGMVNVEVIGSDFFVCPTTESTHNDTSQSKLFPSLKELNLVYMLKLKEWVDPSGLWASAFPCLEKLLIKDCLSLVRVPTCFHSLTQLTVEGVSSELLLMVVSNCCKLISLKVKNVQQLTRLSEPLLKCTSLQVLDIQSCEELVELPPTLRSLGCLKILNVRDCDSLTSLPDIEGLVSLSILDIWSCGNITAAPHGLESCMSIERLELVSCRKLNLIPDLASLSRLRLLIVVDLSEEMLISQLTNQLSGLSSIMVGGVTMELQNFSGLDQLPKCVKSLSLAGGPKLTSLPDELKSLTQLERLDLFGCVRVTELPEWLGNLSSLETLNIRDCFNMKHLPSLDAMRRLTRLRELIIKGCPELEERCRKEGGEEWHKISHLPTILFNDEEDAAE